MRTYVYRAIASEFSNFVKFYDRIVQINAFSYDQGILLNNIKCPEKASETIESYLPLPGGKEAILLNGNLNNSLDIQSELSQIHQKMGRRSRVLVVAYNPYLAWLYKLGTKFGFRKGPVPTCFITNEDLKNIFELSNFEIISQSMSILCPFWLFGLGTILNKISRQLPLIRNFSLVSLIVLRPVKLEKDLSISIIIPARNEAGNIQNALDRIPAFSPDIEVIFVEGNSKDNTLEEIKRVIALPEYTKRYTLKLYQQPGKGKFDAVKVGFRNATKDLMVILDADLTMPPEKLPQFYNAYAEGKADFINGSRQVYPMEGEAMKFLNMLGNKFFATFLSYLIETKLTDSLCGTKLFHRKEYTKMSAWRDWFGDFDPFGDFEMIFAASELKLGIIDVPVHYKARTYGETQIRRFRDGFLLLRMTMVALFKIKLRKL